MARHVGFTDPEIVFRLEKKQHIGLVIASDDSERIDALLKDYGERIARDHLMTLPPAMKASG